MNEYRKLTLPNGLRVVTIPMKDTPSVTVDVYVAAGGRFEQKNKMGLSHFLEHMFFKGTKKRPTTLEIASLIDGVGGDNNAATGKDYTHFYLRLKADQIELAFDILSDMLANSLYDETEINKERGTVTEELNMYEDMPMSKVEDVFLKSVFEEHPLGWDLVGTKKTLQDIKRNDFLDYAKNFYHGNRMVLAVAGNFEQNQVDQLTNKYFSSFPAGKEIELNEFKVTQKEPRVKVYHKKTDQAHLFYGFPTFSFFDPDRQVVNLLAAILGGGMSSRLFIEVRERRGLAYYVAADKDFFADAGIFAARAGVSLDKIKEAIKVIKEELNKTTLKGEITTEELTRAKEMLKGRTALSLENSRNVAGWYGDREIHEGKVQTPKEVFEQIDQISLEDITRVAKRIIKPELLNLAIVGPYQTDNFVDLL